MNSDSNVLITGGSGFIGAHLAARLVDRGQNVIVYDRGSNRDRLDRLGIADSVDCATGDITDAEGFMNVTRDNDVNAIVHLASMLGPAVRQDPQTAIQVNIEGTNTVFEAGRHLSEQIDRIVWSSSLMVYGPQQEYGDRSLDDTVSRSPSNLYGSTKLFNESQSEVYRTEFDVSAVGIRPPIVFGPYQMPQDAFIRDLFEKPALGQPYTVPYADEPIPWQHVADTAQAFVRGLTADADTLTQAAYNIRGPIATPREIGRRINRLLDEEYVSFDTTEQLALPVRLDTDAAREDLGYGTEYDLDSAIRRYINHVRADHDMHPV